MLGFEKTFLDGNASFGVRAPFQQGTDGSVGIDGFGDISLVGKYAVYNDKQTGTSYPEALSLPFPPELPPHWSMAAHSTRP